MRITSVRHAWPNPPGFFMKRPLGHSDYSFVHFTTSVELYIDDKSIIVPEHACIIYNPGTPQYFYCPDGMVHDWFHFVDVPPDLFEKLSLPTDVLIFPNQWSFITELVEEIENEFFAQREYDEELIDIKAKELFIKLSRSVSAKNKYDEITDQKIKSSLRQLRAEIVSNLSHTWTVAEMASRLMLSESRFAHVYHVYYGTSPIDDVIRVRINKAQSKLKFTDDPVSEIANSLGYRNTTHFCRQFRKCVGLSPSQYRCDSR